MEGDRAHNKGESATIATEQARFLKLLGNPSRLRILALLVEEPRQVGDLEAALNMSQAYVSQQLARLRAEGIVEGERSGRAVRYRVLDLRVQPVLEALYASTLRRD